MVLTAVNAYTLKSPLLQNFIQASLGIYLLIRPVWPENLSRWYSETICRRLVRIVAVAQILLTGYDVREEESHRHFCNTLSRLLELGALPIINENDTVATEEIVIGDNDSLAAIVSVSANADLLILLSDIDGLYSADPRVDPNATMIHRVEEVTDEILALGGGIGSGLGTGGMATKLSAAKMATEAGCDMIIANGENPSILYDIVEGKEIGTRFVAGGNR